ncbi:pyridoxamine 5'-phosphate oxidase family protein [Kitasatospora sp. NPDC088134]|uniref:pyridoxamine 5'-phosphate oxidase family protein n=1 Tax=Kitasatospora sp. NPDC088134 TaxID=3364071 RepID=UPI003829CB49
MERTTTASAEDFLDRALVEEAAKKSGLLWVRPAGQPHARPLWHAWHDGAVVVVGGGAEQPLHGLAAGSTAELTFRSKDKGGRLVALTAAVALLDPGTPGWDGAVEELKGKRLNAPDTDTVADRWARECRVLRLVPDGPLAPLPDGPLAAAPLPTPATTRRPIPAGLPKLLFAKKR